MAEDKVSQLKEELGLESESSTGSLDMDKCPAVFKKESVVPGHKSPEGQVEDTEGNQDLPDNNGSFGADISEATSSDKGVDFKTSSSIADSEKTQVSPASGKLAMEDLEIGSSTDTLKGKDLANQGKVDLDDVLSSGQFGLKESDDGDGKSTVGHQASPVATEESLDFADNSSPEKSEAASVEKKLNMKDAPLSEPDKTQISSTPGKIEDLETGNSTVTELNFKQYRNTLERKDSANQEKSDLDDELSSGQSEFKESDDGDGKSTDQLFSQNTGQTGLTAAVSLLVQESRDVGVTNTL